MENAGHTTPLCADKSIGNAWKFGGAPPFHVHLPGLHSSMFHRGPSGCNDRLQKRQQQDATVTGCNLAVQGYWQEFGMVASLLPGRSNVVLQQSRILLLLL